MAFPRRCASHTSVRMRNWRFWRSVTLMEKFAFTRVGDMKEVGRKFGRWVDVGIWQLLL